MIQSADSGITPQEVCQATLDSGASSNHSLSELRSPPPLILPAHRRDSERCSLKASLFRECLRMNGRSGELPRHLLDNGF
jgi:hypothetical protein